MKKSLKWILWILIIGSVVGYSVFSVVQPLQAELLEVQTKTVQVSFQEEGLVIPVTKETLYSRTNGWIEKVFVKEGQEVKLGDLLIKVDTKETNYQLMHLEEQKNSMIGQERKAYEEMELQLARLRGELQSIEGQQKQSIREPYKAQVKQQQLAIEDVRRQLEAAETAYRRTKILFDQGLAALNELIDAEEIVKQHQNNLLQQEQAFILMQEQAKPSAGDEMFFEGQKKAIQSQIAMLEQQLGFVADSSGTKQYYQGMIEAFNVQIEQIRNQIEQGEIRASSAGVVSDLNVKEGMTIYSHTALLALFQPDQYEVETFLLTEDIISIQKGMVVQLIQQRKDGDVFFEGEVVEIAPSAVERISALGLEEKRVKVTIKLNDHISELRPGYALDVKFTTFQQENQIAVPKIVLFPYEGGDALWVVREGKAAIQPVQKGLENDQEVVILAGLQIGDKVIKNPQLEGLNHGKSIK